MIAFQFQRFYLPCFVFVLQSGSHQVVQATFILVVLIMSQTCKYRVRLTLSFISLVEMYFGSLPMSRSEPPSLRAAPQSPQVPVSPCSPVSQTSSLRAVCLWEVLLDGIWPQQCFLFKVDHHASCFETQIFLTYIVKNILKSVHIDHLILLVNLCLCAAQLKEKGNRFSSTRPFTSGEAPSLYLIFQKYIAHALA